MHTTDDMLRGWSPSSPLPGVTVGHRNPKVFEKYRRHLPAGAPRRPEQVCVLYHERADHACRPPHPLDSFFDGSTGAKVDATR